MCSNWALRSGCREPSSALRLDWREKPSFTSSLATVSALIGWPICVSVAASLSMLLDTQSKGRMGSPRVTGSTKFLRAGTNPGSFSATALRPPPARRTRPFASGAASRSSSPRLIVERASPVILDTTASPPQPALRTSPAANNRRPRSSSFEPTASHRCRMAPSSIMRPTYACSLPGGIPALRVTPPHHHRSRFSYCSKCPKPMNAIRRETDRGREGGHSLSRTGECPPRWTTEAFALVVLPLWRSNRSASAPTDPAVRQEQAAQSTSKPTVERLLVGRRGDAFPAGERAIRMAGLGVIHEDSAHALAKIVPSVPRRLFGNQRSLGRDDLC